MFAQPVDGDWGITVAPVRLARFMIGFVAVLAAMAVVGAVFYLAMFALAGAVSFAESDLAAAVAATPGVGH